MNLVHFLVVVATIGLVAFAGHSDANDWIMGDILEADRSLQKLNICSTSTNAEILKKITKWIGRSKENQIPRVIVDLNRLRLSDDCMSLNVALDYNDMIQSNQHKVSRCLRSYAEAAAAEFTSRCAEKLSRDNWSQFEYAMEWRMHGDHTDLIDEIMADQFAGSESFDDLNLYQRFANGIRSVANKRHVLIQQLTEPIGKLCFWSRILFKNMANSDPKGRLTTRIKNLYIAQRLWSDMLQARDKKFVSLVEKFDPADRRLLSEAAQGSAVNFGVRMMASDHQISEEEARTKLRSLCRSIDARDLAIIKFIEHMRLWTGRDEYSFAVASFCAQLNFPGAG